MNFKGRNCLTLKDFTREEIEDLLSFAAEVKGRLKRGEDYRPLKGKVMTMIFQKPSLRTRVSFETGMYQLGGMALYLGPSDIGLGKRETTEDIARVLGQQVNIIMARVFGHAIVEDLGKYAGIPVINGLSDFTHPCQALADFQTIAERGKPFAGTKLTFVGEGNNVANSLIFGGVRLGMHICVASPQGYEVTGDVVAWAEKEAKVTGGKLTVTNSIEEGAAGADVLYTDVWTSMGQEAEQKQRLQAFKDFQINMDMLAMAEKDAIVLHCLPAHYGEEITRDAAYSQNSAIFDEAENRLHAEKALIVKLMGGKE
jgi:ornithine carbamoyltransferase